MKKKILLIYTNYSTFVETDYKILSSNYEVAKYRYIPGKGFANNAKEYIKQFFYLLTHIWKYDATYTWFADYHSFLPIFFSKIFSRKSYLVIGGYDVANLPAIKYGSLTRPLRKSMTVFSLKHATLCIPVVKELEIKLREVCPSAKSITVNTGYELKLAHAINFNAPREKVILTVSITENYQRYIVKGLDRFKELAKKLPDYNFYIIGVKENGKKLFDPIPENLFLLPPLKQEELTEYYLKAKYYAQFSRSEGLPNALCEAMLHGCIPLGINAGGISTAIGKYGLVANNWEEQVFIDFIKQETLTNRESISQSIINRFDIKYRKDKLLELIA